MLRKHISWKLRLSKTYKFPVNLRGQVFLPHFPILLFRKRSMGFKNGVEKNSVYLYILFVSIPRQKYGYKHVNLIYFLWGNGCLINNRRSTFSHYEEKVAISKIKEGVHAKSHVETTEFVKKVFVVIVNYFKHVVCTWISYFKVFYSIC